MSSVVTVAIPVLDGARYLDEVLSAVRAQELPEGTELELLVVDSGSADGSVEIARRHGAVVHEIARAEFSHGGTRNRMMEWARGAHVAFLTQDATPAGAGWLAALLRGFAAAPDVGAVFGPQRARADAPHPIAAELDRFWAVFGGGDAVDVQRLDRSAAGIAAYRRNPGRLSFLSSVNCCVARRAWERVPFRDVPYGEDQLLGRELLEAGFAKAYVPDAAVLHSHDYPPAAFLRRYFDEWRSLREVLGFVQPAGPRRTLWDLRGLMGHDKRWLRARGVHGPALVRALAVSARHHSSRMAGAIAGSRADRLPARVRGALSLEGRDSFVPVPVPESPLLGTGGDAELDPDWEFEFVRRAHPLRPVRVEGRPASVEGPWRVAWVVPNWTVGSGGHMTIFRLVEQLERRGHRCAIFYMDPFGRDPRPAHVLRREMVEEFRPVRAPLLRGFEEFDSADVCVATNWWTAWAARDLPRCAVKAYLVQDHEPDFNALGAEQMWAAETYRMGYSCVTYSRWMAEFLGERYGVDARFFEGGTDLDVYPFAGPENREPGVVAVYGRRETARRAVDLATAALATVFERRPGLRAEFFGSRWTVRAPFPAVGHGILSPHELSALYRRASVGVCLSLTNHSLVAQEMMASGLPLVELEGANAESEVGPSGERALLAPARVDALADGIEHLLDHPDEAWAMARRAREWVEGRTWERAGEQFEAALRSFLQAAA